MGYKLAGFDVIGCNEIDPRMNKCYVANHHPKYNYLCDIREMVKAVDLPAELYNLDVLDGSPPCSTFSISGDRENSWGVEKHFREGQKSQILDTLFFEFIKLAKKLQPKIVVAENVKGILLGNAKSYVSKIMEAFYDAGYLCKTYLLNAKDMGVPQRRERVFFLCVRKDLASQFIDSSSLFGDELEINMIFNEKPITLGDFADFSGEDITAKESLKWWKLRIKEDDGLGDVTRRLTGKEKLFNYRFDKTEQVPHTLCARDAIMLYDYPKRHSDRETKIISTFPQDYNFLKEKPTYMCGMSVPPVMMAQVASRVYEQWLSKINAK